MYNKQWTTLSFTDRRLWPPGKLFLLLFRKLFSSSVRMSHIYLTQTTCCTQGIKNVTYASQSLKEDTSKGAESRRETSDEQQRTQQDIVWSGGTKYYPSSVSLSLSLLRLLPGMTEHCTRCVHLPSQPSGEKNVKGRKERERERDTIFLSLSHRKSCIEGGVTGKGARNERLALHPSSSSSSILCPPPENIAFLVHRWWWWRKVWWSQRFCWWWWCSSKRWKFRRRRGCLWSWVKNYFQSLPWGMKEKKREKLLHHWYQCLE